MDPKSITTDKSKDKCYYCGRDRHPNNGTRFGWKDNCPQRMQRAKIVKRLGTSQICLHAGQSEWHASKLSQLTVLNPQIWSI